MEGQQLPKATMNSFIKSHTNTSFSADYLAKVLLIAKEFIARVADKSNIMCESVQKKTISSEHLQAALTDFGLTNHLHELRLLEENIKEQNQFKRQSNQKLEEMLAKEMQEEREKRKLEQQEKKVVTVRQKFAEIERIDIKVSEDQDYQNLIEDDEHPNGKPHKHE